MDFLRFSIAAGETKSFIKAGRYFEILESANPITVSFYDDKGSQADDMTGALSGVFAEGPFSQFDVFSATAQSVLIMVHDGRGGSRRQPGNVRVIDEITDALQVSYYAPALATQAWVAEQIVAPSANVAGIIVRASQASVQAGATGTAAVGFVAARSLPTGYQVPAQRWTFAARYNPTNVLQEVTEKTNKLIPPGWGLYSYREIQVVAAIVANGSISYELLT